MIREIFQDMQAVYYKYKGPGAKAIPGENLRDHYRIQQQALEILHHAAEDFVISVLGSAQLCAIHAGRVTLKAKDIQLAKRIRGDAGEKIFIDMVETEWDANDTREKRRARELKEFEERQERERQREAARAAARGGGGDGSRGGGSRSDGGGDAGQGGGDGRGPGLIVKPTGGRKRIKHTPKVKRT